MVNHVVQSGEAAIMVEATPRMREQPFQRRGPVLFLAGTAVGLEVIHANLVRAVKTPARLSKQRRHMARGAFCFALEKLLPGLRQLRVVAAGRRRGRGE